MEAGESGGVKTNTRKASGSRCAANFLPNVSLLKCCSICVVVLYCDVILLFIVSSVIIVYFRTWRVVVLVEVTILSQENLAERGVRLTFLQM